MDFIFSNKAKKFTFALMGVGLLLLVLGIFTDHSHHTDTRVWTNLLINGFFFFGVALAALFYLALHYATESGWAVVLKRIFEATLAALPMGMIVLLIVFAAASGHLHHIYHWMDHDVIDPASNEYDEIIANKTGYLNQPFFWIRTIAYMAVFYIYMKGFRKRSLQEDLEGGTKIHFTNFKKSAVFLVFFSVFSSTMSWDWIMSIDTHWFSTLFGWYNFAGMWVSAMVFMTILIVYLKSKGYLAQVNESHIHDMGKWVFALSFLWSYLWFSQFMLIWYANIPEEVTYYIPRLGEYKALYFGMFMINFIFPMILLMSRDAKRSAPFLIFVGLIIFVGHWLDVFMMVTPGTMHNHGGISALEIGMFMLFLGGFIFYVLTNLSKRPLMVKNHPYLDESLHHDI